MRAFLGLISISLLLLGNTATLRADDPVDLRGKQGVVDSSTLKWESPRLGRLEGWEAIRGFFRRASGIFSFAIHYSSLARTLA